MDGYVIVNRDDENRRAWIFLGLNLLTLATIFGGAFLGGGIGEHFGIARLNEPQVFDGEESVSFRMDYHNVVEVLEDDTSLAFSANGDFSVLVNNDKISSDSWEPNGEIPFIISRSADQTQVLNLILAQGEYLLVPGTDTQ